MMKGVTLPAGPSLEKPIPTPASPVSTAGEEGGPLHSVLISGRSFDAEEAERYLRCGIKVAWMTDPVQLPARLEAFAHSRVRLLTLHPATGVSLKLVDGRRDGVEPEAAVLDGLVTGTCPPGLTAFNPEQYRIEHGAPGTDLLVMAGAGTGKTHVMVERILYLLATVQGLEPRHIAMITFTRDATREMRERIVRTLSLRLRLTGQERFRRWVFGLSSMRINTFHAFGKHLLERHGSLLGLPQELELRGLRRQRQRHILEGLNKAIGDHSLMDKLQKIFHGHPLYEVEDAMERIWTRLENIGVRATGALDWGSAAPEHAALNTVLAEALTTAAQLHEAWKKREGAIELNDLTRHLPTLAGQLGTWREPIRFLFVDEFQDTDNVQIDAICSIKRATGAALFVVGDVKQSIYRFRGAEHTAFSRLKNELKQANLPEPLSLPLQRNYRTAPEILGPLHQAFTAWGKRGLLPYSNQDRLIACMKPGGRKVTKEGSSVEDLIRAMGSDGTRVLLVRTNHEALESRDAAEAAGFPCDVERGGSFFRTDAVRDMAVLLRALLHPREPVALAAWLCSPWCSARVPWSVLADGWGEPAALPDRIGALFAGDEGPGSFLWLQKAARDLRDWPLLTVLRRMMHEMNPASRRMTDNGGQPEDRLDAMRYLNHLDQLFTLLHEKFDKDFLALPMLDAWLRQHMATDGETDEDALEVVPGRLKAITVHRAKGLEWDAVALPCTDRSFTAAMGFQVHVEPGGSCPRIGWTWRSGGSAESAPQNSHWKSLNKNEERETRMEETRLLYVALTRSRRELIVNIEPPKSKMQDNSWSALLKDLP